MAPAALLPPHFAFQTARWCARLLACSVHHLLALALNRVRLVGEPLVCERVLFCADGAEADVFREMTDVG